MVYAFFVQCVHPKFCEVLYSQMFNVDSGTDSSREGRKKALDVVARRVSVEYETLRRMARSSSYDDGDRGGVDDTEAAAAAVRLRNDGIPPDMETGMFALNPVLEPYYSRDKVVLWCVALQTAFVLILESNENRVLANVHLKFLAKNLQDHVQAMTNPKEVLAKPDIVMHVVDCLIPAGMLRFISHKGFQQLERDIEKRISSGTK